MRANSSLLAASLLERGVGDAMLCGAFGRAFDHLAAIRDVIGLRPGVHTLAVMQMLLLPHHQLFICDTHYNADPDAEQITEIALLAAEEVQPFRRDAARCAAVAFELRNLRSAERAKNAAARDLIRQRNPHLAVEGEMRGDAHIWYIAVAVQIYIIVSISLFLKNRYWILLSTVFAVSLLANLSYTISIVPYGLFLPFFSQFYIGLAVYWAIKSDIIGQLGSYLYITLMVCILIMVIGISMYTVNLNELFAFIFGVIILVLHPYDKYYSRLFMIRWLSIIGLFSYSLYLIHVRLSDLWFMIVRNLIPILSPVLATPCITIPCVVLSAYIWYCFFEKQVSILDVLVGLRHPFREVANRRELSH